MMKCRPGANRPDLFLSHDLLKDLPMKNRWFILSLTMAAASCGQKKSSPSRLASDTPAAELGVSDLSILVPLQSATFEDPNDSLFGKIGTGMRNAPTLDAGGEEP